MEQKQEPQRPKIGTEEVRRAADILRRYHAGKRQLEQRIIDKVEYDDDKPVKVTAAHHRQ